ncbi:MAG: hypothetical protein L0H37_08635, partial [Nitrosospira sp.]|nr:hypothetical protein [Nitrosospira sp.]
MSSLKMMARVRNLPEAGFDFKLRDLTQRPTIAALLGLDAPDSQAAEGAQALLALNLPGEEKAGPVFCLHAGFGTVFDYQPLVR